MTHVGVERFRACDAEKYAAKNEKPDSPAMHKKSDRVARINGGEHVRMRAMPVNPRPAMTMNHSSMMGPNALPIFSVPNLCAANSATRIATAAGITNGLREAVATLTPSNALNTEIAGVMTPSP